MAHIRYLFIIVAKGQRGTWICKIFSKLSFKIRLIVRNI